MGAGAGEIAAADLASKKVEVGPITDRCADEVSAPLRCGVILETLPAAQTREQRSGSAYERQDDGGVLRGIGATGLRVERKSNGEGEEKQKQRAEASNHVELQANSVKTTVTIIA
jgi:hypothetical protein